MKTNLSNLRRMIRESLIQEDYLDKLWLLIESGPEGYNQAADMWDMLDPGNFPLPESHEKFMDSEGRPLLFAALEGSDLDPSGYMEVTWDKLNFYVSIPLSLSTADRSGEMWRGEKYYSVSSNNPEVAESEIMSEIIYVLRSLPEWWQNYDNLEVKTRDDDDLSAGMNDYALVKIMY